MTATTPTPRSDRPIKKPLWKVLWIGSTRGCPVCGERGLFRRWFSMLERCPRCGFRFERREGQFIGAVGINTMVTFAAILAVVVIGLLVTMPDIAVVPLVGATVAIAIVVPVVFYPSSKTLWGGIDLLMSPLEPGESRCGPGTVEGPVEE